jgi:hypothetical protein
LRDKCLFLSLDLRKTPSNQIKDKTQASINHLANTQAFLEAIDPLSFEEVVRALEASLELEVLLQRINHGASLLTKSLVF